jgi:hypothetical protein
MSRSEVQISAFISQTTKDLLERHTRSTGVKKAYLIEMALLHHMKALADLPAEVIIPPRILVDKPTGESLLKRIKKPRKPTKVMRDLMSGD